MPMSNKNKGVSTIELLIVIAILAIFSIGTFITISRIGYANTMKAAKIIDSTMCKLRLETMTKETKQYLYLYNKNDSIYMKVSPIAVKTTAELNVSTGKKIAERNNLYYKTSTGRTRLAMEDSIRISFERGSGAFEPDDGYDYDYIELQNSSKTAVIQCVKETGRHWVE